MARTRTTSATELLIELHTDSPVTLHSQLEHGLRTGIRSGRLPAGLALPSTRALAGQLGLSRGVVVEAYEQLVAEGYLSSRHGAGTRVAANVAEVPATPAASDVAPEPKIEFAYGHPDVSQFPRQVWLRSLRRVLNEVPSDRLSYIDGRGAPEVRDALAAYLNRVRATAARPDQIVVSNGFVQGLSLTIEVLKANGARLIAREDPGQPDVVEAARRHGLETVPVPVDDDGIVVEALERTSADAVVITPAHHFPTGAVMPPARRAALVAWARASRALIVEDDYDAEYRYDREPIGAIHGLAPESVIYTGSASKTLAPGLRLGWLIAPAPLAAQLAVVKEANDRGSAILEQLAFADFLSRGEFDHHLRRMRPIYRQRRDVLLRALRQHMPELRPVGASAGLHVAAWLPDGVDDATVVERAAALGVRLRGLTRYRTIPHDGPGGLLFGYGAIAESEIEAGVRLVARALDEARSGYQ